MEPKSHGRNAHLADGVQPALGRQPPDFSNFAREAAKSGVWSIYELHSGGS